MNKRREWDAAPPALDRLPMIPQPFRAGLIFGAGPLGLDGKHRPPMVHSFLDWPQASQPLGMTKEGLARISHQG